MGDSAWTVDTNINFDRINAMIKDMSNQLTERKTYNVTSGIPFVQNLSKRLDTGLTANVERLHTVEERFKILQDAVLAHHSERSKRAIFNGIGSGMKWLWCSNH